MNYFKQYKLKNYKWILLISIIVISIFGITMVGSAKESLQEKQMYGVIAGIIMMIIVSFFDYKWIVKFQWVIYTACIGLSAYVLFFGKEVNGASRWIDLKIISFQPSEIIKIFLVIFFAKFFADHKENLNTTKVIALSFLLFVIPTILVLLQPDLSTTISIIAVFVILLYLSGLSYKIIVPVLLIFLPIALGIFWYVLQPDQVLLDDYQQKRILAWLNPDDYADDTAYQQTNSIIAIGSGQLEGKGLDENTTTSVSNGNFISEPQTDFIFAIIGEELGFQGCCLVIMFLFFIIMQCIMIGMRARIFVGKLICYGIASQIGIQAFINMGVATGVLPNTGIPLPFISYGLSSLFSLYLGVGIVLNIGLQQKNILKGD